MERRLTYGTESAKPLLVEVGLNRIDTLDDHIDAHIELLVVYQEGVLDVSLHQVLYVVCIARQIMKLLYQSDAVPTSAFWRFRDESLVGEVSHVLLQVLNLVWQEEGVRHETIVDWEEALETTDDDTEDVFLSEVLS